MDRVLLVFVDGIGLGVASDANPFTRPRPGFSDFSLGDAWTAGTSKSGPSVSFTGIDACLGMEGLPQSGTGQASLYTGLNCVQLAGRHYGPYPHSATREALREQSVFLRVGPSRCTFANAYPPKFFEWVGRTKRYPVTTRACLDAGIEIRTTADLEAGHGVAADITGKGLAGHPGLNVTEVTPEVAGRRLVGLSRGYAFTLLEIFHTDKAGHAQDPDKAEAILAPLGGLLAYLAEHRDPELTVVVTSDHGNLEDLSVKTHTRNPVPLAVIGPGAPAFRDVRDLTGVTPAIAELVRR
ncbi:MAG: 2,3-bisphosphoglycerate-independent phosphoglycerate mutase [Rhodothermales bacterium]